MAKIQEIRELELETLRRMQDPQEFERFLRTSAHLHRYSFPEQVLIFAQRPDVTAVAPMETWNANFGRYVTKGSKGIAVVAENRLRYVFELADTTPYQPQMHEINLLWEFPKERKIDIFMVLEQKFGECFVDYDNHEKFVRELVGKLTDDEVVQTSASIVILERLGYSTEFRSLGGFNSVEEVVEIGTETGKIARVILDEFREQAKIFEMERILPHNEEKEADSYDVIQASRRLPNPRIEPQSGGENLRQVGNVAETALQSNVGEQIQFVVVHGRVNSASQSSGRTSDGIARTVDAPNETHETTGDNGLGAGAELADSKSGRNSDEPVDNGLKFPDYAIDEVLKKGSGFVDGKIRIYEAWQNGTLSADFLKDEYGIGGSSHAFVDDNIHLSQDHSGKGLLIRNGDDGKLFTWKQVELMIARLCRNDEYLSEKEKSKVQAETGLPKMQSIFGKEDEQRSDSTATEGSQRERSLRGRDNLPLFNFPTEAEQIAEIDFNEQNKDLIGKIFVEGKRTFKVEKISEYSETASCMDITFAENVGFPIFREEQIERVRGWVEDYEEAQKPQNPDIPEFVENYQIVGDYMSLGSDKEKFRNNIEAIKLVKTLENNGNIALPEEQEILAKYVGWGGLANCFKDDTAENAELQEVLTLAEYASARKSTTDSFYTSPLIIKAMYEGLERLGFNGGSILESSCGIGNFFGCLPESLANSRLYGVEIDDITAKIAKHLYPQANIQNTGFENTQFADGYFDVAIGNVPFGQFGVNDSRYNKYNFYIHDYFFAKTLDKVRAGGVVAFITSKGTLDKKDAKVREYLAQRADLLGAIRLPNTAFKDNAGTETTTDIIFLQKRENLRDLSVDYPNWIETCKVDGVFQNRYFAEHPEMICGEMALDERMNGKYGRDDYTTCKPTGDLKTQLSEAIANIKGEIKAVEIVEMSDEPIETLPADPFLRNYSFAVVNDEIYYQVGSVMEKRTFTDTATERIKGMVEIRDIVRSLIDLQMDNCSDEELTAKQNELNSAYERFTNKWGLLNSRENKRLFATDSSAPLLCALEILDDKKELKEKSDMFTKRTIKQQNAITHCDTSVEALGVSLGEKACVDLPFMQELTGFSKEQIVEDLHGVIYKIKSSDDNYYQNADEYLSGNVREKLIKAKEWAENDPQYQINVEALEKVIPPDIGASEIDVRLGATWITPADYKEFIGEMLGIPEYQRDCLEVEYNDRLVRWNVKCSGYWRYNHKVTTQFGTERINTYKIVENSLNLKDVKIFDYFDKPDGKKEKVLNKKETAIALEKQNQIKEHFKNWIWQDPARRERLVRYYNDNFNNIRPREYDGSHLRFNGMNIEKKLDPHQINAVARSIYGGNSLFAHEVGAGKTYEIVASCMESKRLGICTKSMIVVPNHLTGQWATEFLSLYPNANLLITRKEDFETSKRKEFCARVATGDYDAVIIGHSQFGKLPISKERQAQQIYEEIEAVANSIADVKAANGENWAIKQMEAMKKRLEVRLEKLNDQSKKDNVLNFEELGIDRLYIDESDEFKNLFLHTKMTRVAGIAQTDALKSSDLYAKCRYMDEITDNKGVVFATGTPIANSMCELFTVQRYLQYDELERRGLLHFDSWASTFGETVTAIELAPEGTGYRTKTRFAKFYNLPELMACFKECADIQTADMLNLPTPDVEYHNIAVPADEFQKEIVQSLADRAESVRNGDVKPTEDNMLKITNDGRKLALDKRLINPLLPDHEGSKVNACVRNVYEIWENTKENRLTQLIFCDISTPCEGFNVYDDVCDKLIKMGVPQEEIAFIHDANTDARKDELFAKVNNGTVRILMGSTPKMGAGTNVQEKLIASHNLDCPWRPRDLTQRGGRIVRRGNTNSLVHIYNYVTENTFDSYLWQIIENKQRFISQIMTSKNPARRVDDIDEATLNYAEIKALATGNPYIKEKMELDIDVNRLKMLKSGYQSQKYNLEDFVYKEYPAKLATYGKRIEGFGKDIETYKAHYKDEFSGMTICGKFYSEKADAGAALIKSLSGITTTAPTKIGEYMGFDIEVQFETFDKKYTANLQGATYHKCDLGASEHGNIQRFDNMLAKMADDMAELQQRLISLDEQKISAEQQLALPFDKANELSQKEARLQELNALLSVDQNDNEAVLMDDEEVVKEAEFVEIGDDER